MPSAARRTSRGRFGVLTVLHKHGAMSPSELAEHERVRPPSMTRAVNALVEMGLVEKGEHASDRRQVVVRLTDAGVREVKETRRRRDAWLTQQLSSSPLTKERPWPAPVSC